MVLSILLILICVFPVFFLCWNSFKTNEEYNLSKFSPPNSLTTFATNIKDLMEIGILRSITNSIIVVIIGVFLSAIFTSMAGFTFSKLKFPGKNFIFWGVIGCLAIPAQILIIPLYVFYSKLGITDNLFSLAIFYSIWSFAWGTYLMTSFYRGIPDELLASARIDGANNFQIYLKIMIPLGKPGIIAVSVINFFWFWNELFISFILNRTNESKLITPFIALYGEQGALNFSGSPNWPLIFTASLLSLVIPIIIYIVFQNNLVEGLTVGAVKG